LQPDGMEAERLPEREQSVPIRAHEVRHAVAVESVPMKPNAAVEGEAHPLAAARELPVALVYPQAIFPSVVASPGGVAMPEKR